MQAGTCNLAIDLRHVQLPHVGRVTPQSSTRVLRLLVYPLLQCLVPSSCASKDKPPISDAPQLIARAGSTSPQLRAIAGDTVHKTRPQGVIRQDEHGLASRHVPHRSPRSYPSTCLYRCASQSEGVVVQDHPRHLLRNRGSQ